MTKTRKLKNLRINFFKLKRTKKYIKSRPNQLLSLKELRNLDAICN